MSKISQVDNFKANFGYCLRSSSIFYVPSQPIRTKILLSNYWKFKNNIDVYLIANYRNIKGKLLKRENISFDDCNVKEIDFKNFCGSIEIETFAATDLRIPYSAVMIVYESIESISMVHSYTRIYSNHEVEDKKTICDGHESCWILKDNMNIESYGVFHNGYSKQPEQKIKLEILNSKGNILSREINFREIQAYETVIIKPGDYFNNLNSFLDGEDGNCSIHFNLSNAFTRLLLFWKTKNNNHFQVTHSNFDYSIHETDFVNHSNINAYMPIPKIDGMDTNSVVYPTRTKGNYYYKEGLDKEKIIPDNLFSLKNKTDQLIFSCDGDLLPSRLITGIKIISPNKDILPCEMSLGVYHSLRPPKRFHWGLIHAKFNSLLIINTLPEIYGEPEDPKLCIRLYGQNSLEVPERIINWNTISKLNKKATINIFDLFEDNYFEYDNYIYFSLFSEYGGFICFSTLEKNGSITMEHSF